MKKTRSLATLAGLSLVLFALGATGAKAQQAPSLSTTVVSGSFTLPFQVQWGQVTLPAGDYSLYYGPLTDGAPFMVEVVGKAKGSPHSLILTRGRDRTAAAKNSLICIRQGNIRIVRALEMPVIGETVEFAMPHGVKLLAKQQGTNPNTQLAEAPMLYQQIPVTLNQK